MRRRLLPMVLVLVAAGCANNQLGRAVPACPATPDVVNAVTGTMVLQMQAVDTAEFVPCLNDLRVGWSYEDLVAEHGMSRFWLGSDRLGSRFLEVTLTSGCDVGDIPRVVEGPQGVTEYRQVTLTGSSITIMIVPVTGRETAYAGMLEDELEARPISDRQVFVVFDDTDMPLADKVSDAARRGRPVIIVDEQDVLARTASLQMPGDDQARRGLELDELFDVLEARLPHPSFTGDWYRVFEGGCIHYEFDASGPGVDRLAADVEEAVGLFPAGEVRRAMEAIGVMG